MKILLLVLQVLRPFADTYIQHAHTHPHAKTHTVRYTKLIQARSRTARLRRSRSQARDRFSWTQEGGECLTNRHPPPKGRQGVGTRAGLLEALHPSTIAPTDTKARSRNSIRALCICSLHHSDSLGLASLRTLRRVLDSWLPITLPDRLTLLVVEARIEGTAQSMATKEGGDRTEKASNRRRQPEPERSRRKTTEEQKTKTENRKTSKTRKGKRTADGW